MIALSSRLFDSCHLSSLLVARVDSPRWPLGPNWLHLLSDLGIWGAYTAIPLVFWIFMRRRGDLSPRRFYLLFASSILACGAVHLVEAGSFWMPLNGVGGALKLATALTSWAALLALAYSSSKLLMVPRIQSMPESPLPKIEGHVSVQTTPHADSLRYKALLANSGCAIWNADPLGRFVEPQLTWERITGQINEESQGLGWMQAIDPEARESFRQFWEQGLASAENMRLRVPLINDQSGEYRYSVIEATPILTPDGRVTEWIGTVQDVHDQYLAEAALERAQAEMLGQQQELELLYETAPFGLALHDRDLRYLKVNQTLAAINGIPAHQHIGKSLAEVLPGIADELVPILDRVLKTGATVRDVELLNAPGRDRTQSQKLWLANYHPLLDPEQEVVAISSIVYDVTELKLQSAALTIANSRLERVLRSITTGFLMLDRDYRVQFINEIAIDLFELARPPALNGPIWDLIPDLAAIQVRSSFELAMSSITVTSIEASKEANGGWVALQLCPSAEGLSVFLADATETRRSRIRLERSEIELRRLATVVERSTDFICLTRPDGRGLYLNEEGRKMVGLPADVDVADTSILDYIVTEDHEVMERIALPAMRKAGHWRGAIRFRHWGEGESIPTLCNSFVIQEPGQDPPEVWVTISPDLTEQRSLERALRASEQLALAANQAKTEFLANMSHEIRSPMSSVLGYADILLQHIENADDRACVEVIKRNGKHLLEIVNDILDISRIEAGRLDVHLESTNLPELVREVVATLELRAEEKSLRMDVKFAGPVPSSIRTDPMRLRQILLNIISNAIKFTEVGSVTIDVSTHSSPEGKLLRFSVEDSGIGISPIDQQNLFRPFSQVDSSGARRHEGSGLGLAISRRLTEMLGGTIELKSEIRKGTRVLVSLPLLDMGGGIVLARGEPASEKVLVKIQPQVALSCRVLIVDDRRDVRYLSQHFLEEAGAQVTTADSGPAAIAAVDGAHQSGLPFDVIVMDMQMPEMDGYATVRALRAAGVTRPILALTANAMTDDRERCLEAGCDDYLGKPVDRRLLVVAVGRLVEETPARNNASGISTQSSPPKLPALELQTENSAIRGKIKVLVVDDHEDTANVTALLLRRSGMIVSVAYTGLSALNLAGIDSPTAIVLDLELPDMSGFEVAIHLRAKGFLGRLIALSGRSSSQDREAAERAGFDEFMLKPVETSLLVAAVHAARQQPLP